MFPFSLLVTPLSVFLSLSTATGVVVHDTKIDKATMTALSVGSNVVSQASTKLASASADWHTHAERNSLTQAVHDLKGTNPKVQPRSPSEKKYMSQKNLGLGHNPFDSYSHPVS